MRGDWCMRVTIPFLCLGVAWGSGFVLESSVAAQADDEFDDEFDDDFEDETPRRASPAPKSPAPVAESRSGGDEFDDEFDDEPDTPSEVEASAQVSGSSAAASSSARTTATPESAERRRERFRSHNTLRGPVGGIRVVDAGSGTTGSFRLQLASEFFFAKDFIVSGDDAKHVGGFLSLGWSVHDNVEVFASVQSYANSNDQGDPELFQVLGDADLGVKGFYSPTPWLTVGGDATLALLNTVGDIGVGLKGTSVGLRANLTADLRGLRKPIPFVARLSGQYYFDNSGNLIEDTENERFANLEDPAASMADETRHLVTAIERFGLNINRTDFFRLGLGFESPLRVSRDFYIHPILEWNWSIPINRQGYSCLFVSAAGSTSEVPADADSCLDQAGPSAFPMTLTLGVRILPPVHGLSFLLGGDIGLTGSRDFVRELAPTAPYNILVGISYAYDPDPLEPRVERVEREKEVDPFALRKRVHGVVVEEGSETPVGGATIRFENRQLTALVADETGEFTTYLFEPGDQVDMRVTHPDYEDGSCSATIPSAASASSNDEASSTSEDGGQDGVSEEEFDDPFEEAEQEGEAGDAASPTGANSEGPVETRCVLKSKPKVAALQGRVVDDQGEAVGGAKIQISGADTRELTSDASGAFSASDLPPGSYSARTEAEGYLLRVQPLEIAAREDTSLEVVLITKPRKPLARIAGKNIRIRRQVNFATDSAEILPSSDPLLSEVADLIVRNPHLELIEIQGHTDNRGGRAHNKTLSTERAAAVRAWLVSHGVDSSRLEATGYGPDRPLVPNITSANRARNRRVQFVIKKRGKKK